MEGWPGAALAMCVGYLLGSIPFGIVVSRLGGGTDPRAVGSGNMGATNVLRAGRRDLAALTLLLDGGKGAMAVLLAERVIVGTGPFAGLGAFIGHVFPIWLGWRGGKGVATMLGIALAIHWPTGLVALAAWAVAAYATRYSSVAGISAAMTCPVSTAMFFRADLSLLFLVLALAVLWRHAGNIARLLGGREPRIGRRSPG